MTVTSWKPLLMCTRVNHGNPFYIWEWNPSNISVNANRRFGSLKRFAVILDTLQLTYHFLSLHMATEEVVSCPQFGGSVTPSTEILKVLEIVHNHFALIKYFVVFQAVPYFRFWYCNLSMEVLHCFYSYVQVLDGDGSVTQNWLP